MRNLTVLAVTYLIVDFGVEIGGIYLVVEIGGK